MKLKIKILRMGIAGFLLLSIIGANLFSALPVSAATPRYWVGGTGTWDASSTTHWSTSSGGAGGASVPTASYDVYIDTGSGLGSGGTITVNAGAICNNFTTTVGHTWTLNSNPDNIQIYGNVTLESGLTTTGEMYFFLEATTTGHTITQNGATIDGGYYLLGSGGAWQLLDNCIVGTVISDNGASGTRTFSANGFNVTARWFVFLNGTSVTMGNGTWTATNTFQVWYASDGVITANNSTLKFTDTTIQPIYAFFGNNTYNNVLISRGGSTGDIRLYIPSSVTFNDLTDNGTGAHAIEFTDGTTTTVTTCSLSGSVGNIHTLTSISGGNWNLVKSGGGTVTVSYCTITKSVASPTTTWYYDATCTYNSTSGWATALLSPTVTTQTSSSILNWTFTGNGTITNIGGSAVTVRGICYSTTNNTPTTADSKVQETSAGFSVGAYTEAITGLTEGTTYYVRAFATNSFGTAYSSTTTTTVTNADVYWVGDTGNTSNATAHWAQTSGGTPAVGNAPTATLNAHFNANSFSTAGLTVTEDATFTAKSIDWTGVLHSPTFTGSQTTNIYGSLTYISAMTETLSGAVNFKATSGTNTVTSGGKIITSGIISFNGVGGTWNLQDTLNSPSATIYIVNGILNTNSQTVVVSTFGDNGSTATRSLILGGSSISCGTWSLVPTGMTLTAGTSNINIISGTTFAGGGLTYNNVTFGGAGTSAVAVTGSNIFNSFVVDRSQSAKTLTFTAGTTQLMSDFVCTANVAVTVTLGSSAASVFNLILTGGGSISTDYLVLSYSNATPSTLTWYAGTHSTNNGNNTGWIFAASALPSVQTNSVPSGTITTVQAFVQGTLQSIGIYNPVYVSFNYATDTYYAANGNTYNNQTPEQTEGAATAFSATITGLTLGTIYHVQAVARYGTSLYVYGADVTFTTNGSIAIINVGVFNNYLTNSTTAPDTLIVMEVVNNYAGYTKKTAANYFQVQLLDTDDTTILGASNLQQWGDRPESIYLNAAVTTASITYGAPYYIRVIGYNVPTHPYQDYLIQPADWCGSDLTQLDSLIMLMGLYMGLTDTQNYTAVLADGTQQITDNGVGYFVIGIPDITNIRPNDFTSNALQTKFPSTVSNNQWDSPTAWTTNVGTNISSDANLMAAPFGITGKDFLAAIIWIIVLLIVGVVTIGGGKPLPAFLLCIPIIWLGTYWKILPVQQIIAICIIFFFLGVRQFFIKTT